MESAGSEVCDSLVGGDASVTALPLIVVKGAAAWLEVSCSISGLTAVLPGTAELWPETCSGAPAQDLEVLDGCGSNAGLLSAAALLGANTVADSLVAH